MQSGASLLFHWVATVKMQNPAVANFGRPLPYATKPMHNVAEDADQCAPAGRLGAEAAIHATEV